MSHNRGKDTKPEKILRLALWHHGYRYRKNYKKLPGTPDIAMTKYRIAIFVDGDFWHAKGHQENPGEQVRSNKEYWVKHLSTNVSRDKEVSNLLSEDGWIVLRFWESDVKTKLEDCLAEILQYVPKSAVESLDAKYRGERADGES